MLYSIRSERLLMEEIDYSMLFRWFVGLNLDDIDWTAGQITIHGKGGRSVPLPLAADVGAALAAYLHEDRPPCVSRRVFIRHRVIS